MSGSGGPHTDRLRAALERRFLAPEGTPWADVERWETEAYAAAEAVLRRLSELEQELDEARDALEVTRGAIADLTDGRVRAENVAAEALGRFSELEQALEAFANPQHWAVRREFQEPSYVWIGTWQETPVAFARRVLDTSDHAPAVATEEEAAGE